MTLRVKAVKWADPTGENPVSYWGVSIGGRYHRIDGKNPGWPTKREALTTGRLIAARHAERESIA